MAIDWAGHARRIIERLGETVTYEGEEVVGIFRRPYERDLNGIESSNPTIACMSADVSGIARGKTFTRGGVSYKVIEVKPDPVSETVVAELEA